MILAYSHTPPTNIYSQNSSIIWPVWLNCWVFVYELSGCGFESRCCHLNFRYSPYLEARSLLTFKQTIEWGFTLKLICDMAITYIQMHHIDKYSQRSWVIWPGWLNSSVFVYEVSGCEFQFRCCYLNFRYGGYLKQGVPWHSGKL